MFDLISDPNDVVPDSADVVGENSTGSESLGLERELLKVATETSVPEGLGDELTDLSESIETSFEAYDTGILATVATPVVNKIKSEASVLIEKNNKEHSFMDQMQEFTQVFNGKDGILGVVKRLVDWVDGFFGKKQDHPDGVEVANSQVALALRSGLGGDSSLARATKEADNFESRLITSATVTAQGWPQYKLGRRFGHIKITDIQPALKTDEPLADFLIRVHSDIADETEAKALIVQMLERGIPVLDPIPGGHMVGLSAEGYLVDVVPPGQEKSLEQQRSAFVDYDAEKNVQAHQIPDDAPDGYRYLMSFLKPGDLIILGSDEIFSRAINKTLGGFPGTHMVMYVGGGKIKHLGTKGFLEESLYPHILAEKGRERYIVLQNPIRDDAGLSEDEREARVAECIKRYENSEFDFGEETIGIQGLSLMFMENIGAANHILKGNKNMGHTCSSSIAKVLIDMGYRDTFANPDSHPTPLEFFQCCRVKGVGSIFDDGSRDTSRSST